MQAAPAAPVTVSARMRSRQVKVIHLPWPADGTGTTSCRRPLTSSQFTAGDLSLLPHEMPARAGHGTHTCARLGRWDVVSAAWQSPHVATR